jgi:hypothetical protein
VKQIFFLFLMLQAIRRRQINNVSSPAHELNHKYSTTDGSESSSAPLPEKKTGRLKTNLSPSESPMVVDRTVHAPCDAAEPPKVGDDGEGDDGEDDRFCALGDTPGHKYEVVEHVGCHEDGKVKRRELVRVCRCREGGVEIWR